MEIAAVVRSIVPARIRRAVVVSINILRSAPLQPSDELRPHIVIDVVHSVVCLATREVGNMISLRRVRAGR
jgi:hypothetical protein